MKVPVVLVKAATGNAGDQAARGAVWREIDPLTHLDKPALDEIGGNDLGR